MLPASARLTRSEDFRLVIRRGRRAGRSRLVVHAVTDDGSGNPSSAENAENVELNAADPTRTGRPARVGFVVSKAVGNSVVRHRVSRRLRHVVMDRLGTLPEGTALVVRALPPAAAASSAELAKDFDAAARRLRLLPVDNGGVA